MTGVSAIVARFMNPALSMIVPTIVLLGMFSRAQGLESAPVERPGVKPLRLLTDRSAIVPGETFTVALELEPLPEHHTYWKGPGIVGVATRIDWTMPAGFTAGPILWPPPQIVLMAGIRANGYRGPTLLLTEITAPKMISERTVTLKARASWMACAVSCNPGNADLELSIPVAEPGSMPAIDEERERQFREVRENMPKPAPAGWIFQPRLVTRERIELDLIIPGLTAPVAQSLHFFCHDMQVDSDEDQKVEVIDAAAGFYRLLLSRPDFAPRNPATLSGVLRVEPSWPGLESQHIEIAAVWPGGTFNP